MRKMTIEEIQNKLGYEIEIVAEKQKRKLSDVPIGETCEIAGKEFIVLEQIRTAGATSLLFKEPICDSNFGSTCDYRSSYIAQILDDLSRDIIAELRVDPFTPTFVDLTSEEGRTDFQFIITNISLLNCDLYRRWFYIINKYDCDYDWWLATAVTTLSEENGDYVCCVGENGIFYEAHCSCVKMVRPFCCVKSDIDVY